MALTADLVLKNEAAASKTFTTVNTLGANVTRLDSASTIQLPTKMIVNHTQSGAGDSLVDRHLVQFSRTELDANGIPFTTIVNLTMAVPRRSASNATVKDLVSFIKDLVDTGGAASADLDKILQGQS